MDTQDIFGKGTPASGGKFSFEKAFPDIESINVEVTVTRGQAAPSPGDRVLKFTERDLPESIGCPNPLCANGGLKIGRILREMAAKKETSGRSFHVCSGHDGPPHKQHVLRNCANCFHVNVSIVFKEAIGQA